MGKENPKCQVCGGDLPVCPDDCALCEYRCCDRWCDRCIRAAQEERMHPPLGDEGADIEVPF